MCFSRYEVKFQNGQECGGAYIKLLTKDGSTDLVSSCIWKRIHFITKNDVKEHNNYGILNKNLILQNLKVMLINSIFQRKFYDKSPYTIMFGPDKCGNDNKLHFIFRHKNPVTGEFEVRNSLYQNPTIALCTSILPYGSIINLYFYF